MPLQNELHIPVLVLYFIQCLTLVLGRSIFIFGGFSKNKSQNDLFVLDSATNTWTERTTFGENIPPPRAAHSVCRIGNLFCTILKV